MPNKVGAGHCGGYVSLKHRVHSPTTSPTRNIHLSPPAKAGIQLNRYAHHVTWRVLPFNVTEELGKERESWICKQQR